MGTASKMVGSCMPSHVPWDALGDDRRAACPAGDSRWRTALVDTRRRFAPSPGSANCTWRLSEEGLANSGAWDVRLVVAPAPARWPYETVGAKKAAEAALGRSGQSIRSSGSRKEAPPALLILWAFEYSRPVGPWNEVGLRVLELGWLALRGGAVSMWELRAKSRTLGSVRRPILPTATLCDLSFFSLASAASRSAMTAARRADRSSGSREREDLAGWGWMREPRFWERISKFLGREGIQIELILCSWLKGFQ